LRPAPILYYILTAIKIRTMPHSV